NSLTGIATAWLAQSPLIAVSGARSATLAERSAFQDIDQIGMARPVVKWASQPASPREIPFLLTRAFAEANSGRKGPVHLTIPVGLFTSQATAPGNLGITKSSVPSPDSQQLDGFARLLRSAERPV